MFTRRDTRTKKYNFDDNRDRALSPRIARALSFASYRNFPSKMSRTNTYHSNISRKSLLSNDFLENIFPLIAIYTYDKLRQRVSREMRRQCNAASHYSLSNIYVYMHIIFEPSYGVISFRNVCRGRAIISLARLMNRRLRHRKDFQRVK